MCNSKLGGLGKRHGEHLCRGWREVGEEERVQRPAQRPRGCVRAGQAENGRRDLEVLPARSHAASRQAPGVVILVR